MTPRNEVPMLMESVERQTRYVNEQEKVGGGDSIVFLKAFVNGMRDIGYKSHGWAMAEMIDNAIQAGAEHLEVVFGFPPGDKSRSKPTQMALIDDGVGMIPQMISYAVRWGGTDRENDRTGFGRYGYGLPSSAVSMARRYSVYSRVTGGDWSRVTVDLEELGRAQGQAGTLKQLLSAVEAGPPEWVFRDSKLFAEGLTHGTVIVLEELDVLTSTTGWVLRDAIRSKLVQHFGVIYRNWLASRTLVVDGVKVQIVDPLFLMEHGRWFDETQVRAHRVETRSLEVTSPNGRKGVVLIRASFLPVDLGLLDSENAEGRKGSDRRGRAHNNRFKIMREYNGLLICREGRQIDCIQPWWTKFQNNDVYVKIEIDFDPELDEGFGITTAKQQIVIKEWLQDVLTGTGENNGNLANLVVDLRQRWREDDARYDAEHDEGDEEGIVRPSVEAMIESEKYKTVRDVVTPGKIEEGQRAIKEKASEIAAISGETPEEVVERLIAMTSEKFGVELQAMEEGPFYIPKRLGEQKRVILNTAHPFYSRVYEPAPAARAGIEVLLLVLADAELEANGDMRDFYKAARARWSDRLAFALRALKTDDALADKRAAVAEALLVQMDIL